MTGETAELRRALDAEGNRLVIPLAPRLRHLQHHRVAAVLLTLVLQGVGVAGGSEVVVATLGVLGVAAGAAAAVGARRLTGDHGPWAFGLVLIGDGLLLTTLVHVTGGLATPVRHLVLLHLVVVMLVASHRAGLALAAGYSLAALLVHWLGVAGLLAMPDVPDPGVAVAVHIGLLWLVASITASSSAVTEREFQRRRHDLDALAALSRGLDEVEDVHAVAAVLAHHATTAFDARRSAVISLRDGDPLTLAGDGLTPAAGAGTISGVLGEVAASCATVRPTALGPGDEWLAAQLPDPGRLVLAPLASDGHVDGVLLVEFRPDAVGERTERRVRAMVERFASQGALALANARLRRQLAAMAETDGLTGVANRGAFDRRLAEELARVRRSGGTFGLALCDLDHFRALNDSHGHQTGDQVLVHVAQTLAQGSRPYDVVARVSGAAFGVIMPAASGDVAAAASRRFRQQVRRGTGPVPVTVSIGVVSVEAPTSAAIALAAAERALVYSKRRGRDRVTEAPAITTTPREGPDA